MDRNPNTKTFFRSLEETLIAQAQCGEVSAFERLAQQYRPAIYAHALRMLRDQDDAQDAAQDTFVKACRGIKGFQSGRPMLPWLLRICTNCCVDIIRARRSGHDNIESHEHALCDQTVDLDGSLETTYGSETLREAVRRLPGRYREIVVMRHYRHMDVNEIAESLGRPEGTVKSWLFRARALLRKELATAMLLPAS